MNETPLKLEDGQFRKYTYIRTFYQINHDRLKKIYRRLNGSLKLTPERWARYVESKGLFDLIYPLVGRLTHVTLNDIAYSEPNEFLGVEMHNAKSETYYAMPFSLHDDLTTFDVEKGTLQHATRAFITMLDHMLFKDLNKGPFWILREIEGEWNSMVTLDSEYQYVVVDNVSELFATAS